MLGFAPISALGLAELPSPISPVVPASDFAPASGAAGRSAGPDAQLSLADYQRKFGTQPSPPKAIEPAPPSAVQASAPAFARVAAATADDEEALLMIFTAMLEGA